MTQLILWILISYGMTNIVVYGSIFNVPRNFINKVSIDTQFPFHNLFVFISEMIKCMMCASVWIGFLLSVLIFSPTNVIFSTPLWISWFFDGILSSGAVWAINSIIEWFEENRPRKN